MISLKEARKAAGLTQVEVANYVHVTQSTICQWEQGLKTIPIDRLRQLSKLYDTPMSDIQATEVSEEQYVTSLKVNMSYRQRHKLVCDVIHQLITDWYNPKDRAMATKLIENISNSKLKEYMEGVK
jgi:transcriptional regulator with XRE-family HTH domain